MQMSKTLNRNDAEYELVSLWLKESGEKNILSFEEEQKLADSFDKDRQFIIGCLSMFNQTHQNIKSIADNNQKQYKKNDRKTIKQFPRRLKLIRRNFTDRKLKNLDLKQMEQIQKAIDILSFHGFYKEIDIHGLINILNSANDELKKIENLPISDRQKRKLIYKIITPFGVNLKQFRTLFIQIDSFFKSFKSKTDLFAQSNLRFVINTAKNYRSKVELLNFLDLIQEGNKGLLHAILKFDHKRKLKFSTYALFWIRQSILKSICENEDLIHIPIKKQANWKKLCENRNLLKSYGEYKIDDLCEITGFTEKQIDELDQIYSKQFIYIDQTPFLSNGNGDDDENILESIEDNSTSIPSEACEFNMIEEKMEKIIKMNLDEKRQKTLKLLYGEKGMTLKATGKELGVSRERIRQLREDSLNILRSPVVINKIKSYQEIIS